MDRTALAAHLRRDRFGSFRLTQAIRPALTEGIAPREGYRIQTYRDAARGLRLPALTAAVSRDRLFDVFLALLSPLGPTADVILESSHASMENDPAEAEREGIDLPILSSHCLDFEELLLDDGCTGIAVLDENRRTEVHFDEHKLIYVYSPRLAPFELILSEYEIERDDNLEVVTEAEHIHCTRPHFTEQFESFKSRLGVEEFADQWNW